MHILGKSLAVDLAMGSATLLDTLGETDSAGRIRQAVGSIQPDASLRPGAAMEVPFALIQLALALLDGAGSGATSAACALQEAIDHLRGAKPMRLGDVIDPALLETFERGFSRAVAR